MVIVNCISCSRLFVVDAVVFLHIFYCFLHIVVVARAIVNTNSSCLFAGKKDTISQFLWAVNNFFHYKSLVGFSIYLCYFLFVWQTFAQIACDCLHNLDLNEIMLFVIIVAVADMYVVAAVVAARSFGCCY